MEVLHQANRLAVLSQRREKLIELNRTHNYTSMILTAEGLRSNPKETQYTNLLLKIHEEQVGLWLFNRENNKIYSNNLDNAKKAVAEITYNNLFRTPIPAI